MTPQTAEQLRSKRCAACEGRAAKLSLSEAEEQLRAVPEWQLIHGGRRMRRQWEMRSFRAGMEFLNRVAELAEQEGHHPDIRLERYRQVSIVLWTHAVGGLSENDFILAAKIDHLPVRMRKQASGGGQ